MRKLVVIAALVLGLSGCANAEVPSAGSTAPTTPPATSTTTGSTSTTSTTPPATSTPAASKPGLTALPSAGMPAPPGANEVILDGIVQAGVEEGCTLLLSQGAQYLLLGGDPSVIREGQRVIVRGQAQPGVATTCQQGVPFIVAEARPG